MIRHHLRPGEHLAINPAAIMRDADGFFFMCGDVTKESERIGTVAVIHVRGPLCHFVGDGGDSYEGIVQRVQAAKDDGPTAIVLLVESPGGVVAGCFEAAKKIRSVCAGTRLIAYVSETAASAAYALCCACDEILMPPGGIVGSVGIIATMASGAEADAAHGLDFRLITSGARKADGNPHAPITDAAVAAERGRVNAIAAQFFDLASAARGIPPKKIAALEAGIFLGREAVSVGLADSIMSFDDVLFALDETTLDKQAPSASLSVAQHGTPPEASMAVKLEALIKRTEAAIAASTDPRKTLSLRMNLASYQTALAAMSAESDGGDDDEDSDEDPDEEDSKAAKAAEAAKKAKAKAAASKHKAKAAEHRQKAAEADEAADKCMGDDEEEAAAAIATAGAYAIAGTGASGAASAALAAQAEIARDARLAALETGLAAREQKASITEALAAGSITPAEAKMLAGKAPTWAAEYLDTRKGVRVVNVAEGHLLVPSARPAGDLPAAALAEIEERIAMMGDLPAETVKTLRASMIEGRRRAAAENANGVGRY